MDFYWVPVGALEDGPYQIVANLYLIQSLLGGGGTPERGLKRCLKLKTLSNYWGQIFIINRIGRLNQI